ncbi:N/A [soil metagenome]
MALPALAASGGADVVVLRGLAPLLELAPGGGRVIPLDRGSGGFLATARTLRQRRYRRGILLPPSLSSALLFAAGGVRCRRGTPTDGRRVLLHDSVPAASLRPMHRAAAYLLLVTGEAPAVLPAPRLVVPKSLRERWRALVGVEHGSWIGVFPGSNAPSRRWEPTRFAELVRLLTRRGYRVAVFGGPGERELTRTVAGSAGLDFGGRTDLPLLAAALAECTLLVSNDSGPMHLAAAVGTPTISLWGAGDPAITAPLGRSHELIRRAELPCVPCVKNECPRRGRGYVLDDAHRECMRLIQIDDIDAAVSGRASSVSP